MLIEHNYLRTYRKQSPIIQSDISFLLDLSDDANISRFESGQREPNLTVLLTYHILFDTPIEFFLERQKQEMSELFTKRLGLRVQELKALPPDAKVADRIAFLITVLARLIA